MVRSRAGHHDLQVVKTLCCNHTTYKGAGAGCSDMPSCDHTAYFGNREDLVHAMPRDREDSVQAMPRNEEDLVQAMPRNSCLTALAVKLAAYKSS